MNPIETHSLPTLTRSYPRRFTFYAWRAVALAKVGRLSHSLHSPGGNLGQIETLAFAQPSKADPDIIALGFELFAVLNRATHREKLVD